MNKFLIISAISLSGLFQLNCSHSPDSFKKLEGKWGTGGDDGDGHSWYLEYVFKGDTYAMTGYPPIAESGKMKLKETKGDSMLITFIVKESSPEYKDHDEWVYVKADQLSIGSSIFTRSREQK